MHVLCPEPSWNRPGEHARQELAPPLLYCPEPHDRQLDWPRPPWYCPLEQSVQPVLPAALYRPVAHCVQSEGCFGVALNLPASHSWQDVAPTELWYLPASQSRHVRTALTWLTKHGQNRCAFELDAEQLISREASLDAELRLFA